MLQDKDVFGSPNLEIMDVDGDGEEAIAQAGACDADYERFQKVISVLKHVSTPAVLMKQIAELRTHAHCVKARQPAGFKWDTLLNTLGLESVVGPLTSHRDAMLAAKAKDLVNHVANWARALEHQVRSYPSFGNGLSDCVWSHIVSSSLAVVSANCANSY